MDGAFVDSTAFSVNGGKLDLNNFNVSMSSLMGEGGTLSLGSAALTVDQSANTRFDGNIDGTGSLTKSGTGVLVLNGANTYSGGTTVKEGGLVIGDASHSGASLVGTASVENGAYLAGAGSVGGLYAHAGSIIAPGNSIGTLKVNGNLAFDAGATYVAEIDASGKSDRIDVSGTATLGGAKVYIEKAAGTYMPGKSYTILSAEGGIMGTFGDLSQNTPFVDLGPAYDPNAVYLNIARNDVDFAATAKTGNQKSVAVAVEGLGAGNAVYDTVVMQDSEEDARRAFDALSGKSMLRRELRSSMTVRSFAMPSWNALTRRLAVARRVLPHHPSQQTWFHRRFWHRAQRSGGRHLANGVKPARMEMLAS